MDGLISVGDAFRPAGEAAVSVLDHGLLYGDGVFEGIRAYNGRVFKLARHIERLFASAKAIRLEIPVGAEQVEELVLEACRQNHITDGYIRLVVTRGAGDLSLSPLTCPRATLVIIARQVKPLFARGMRDGITMITSTFRRNPPDALSPAIKSLNYLNNIMAKMEAIQSGCLEALMLNHEGQVAECTGDNIFIVKRGVLKTPPTDAGILEGVTRNTVIELARAANIPIQETALTRLDVHTADECFLTGTAAEVIPVVKCDGRTIGTGKPGPITKQLRERFHQITRQ